MPLGSRWLVVALTLTAMTPACASLSHKSQNTEKIHQVRKLCVVGDFEDPEDASLLLDPGLAAIVRRQLETSRRRHTFLSEALEGYGFVLVGDPTAADATVDLTMEEWIYLDAPPPNPSRNRYIVDLKSTPLAISWRARIYAETYDTRQGVERMYMESLAKKVFAAWKESAVRSGSLTKAQARKLKRIDGSK